MAYVILLALAGGLFSILTFIHFVVDWIFQTHAEAMAKHNNAKVRARHCAIYTAGFVPLLLFFIWAGALSPLGFGICLLILFVSHFVEDTYIPVYLWAKWIRRPPQMTKLRDIPVGVTESGDTIYEEGPNPQIGFVEFIDTTLGKILMIAVDQIIHLAFLLPIVWLVLRHLYN
jgi:hypothetical protein